MQNFTHMLTGSLGMAALVAGSLVIAAPANAAPEKSKITLGYASMSGGFGSFWIAQEKGYFKEQGLEVELLYTRTTVGLQALASGHIDAMGTGCAEFFEANRKGYSNRVVASLFENNLYMLASAKDITKASMLVGKSIAVNRIGDTGHLSVRFALRKLGVDPDKATYVQVGSTPERFSALANGAVAAAVQVGALKPLVLKNKLNILLDLQNDDYPNCLGGIGLKTETIKNNPKMVDALLRAIVKGNAYLAAGPAEETKKIYSKFMKLPVTSKKMLLGWKFFATDAHARKPKITLKAATGVMDMMSEADPVWKKETPASYLDTSFMDKLDSEGYLEKAYKDIESKGKM